MKQFLRRAFSPSAAAGRRRRRRPAVLVGAVVLMWWAHLVLGSNLAWSLAALGISVVAVWVLRQHPEIAVCVAIAIITAATPAVTCVILIDRQVSGAADVAAVLTGYILVAPVPALIACTLRPVPGMAPVNALLGSVVLLLGAATGVVLGDNGAGAAVLLVALSTSVGLIVLRHRRAAAQLLSELPVVNGWTDLCRRTLPDGSRIERLLIGGGQVITCSTAASTTVFETESVAAVRTAAAAARTLGLSDSRVQPVILTEQETPGVQRHLVNDGGVASSVIVTARCHVEDVTRLAPRRRRGQQQRGAVLTAARLPVPTSGTSTG
jgi:hypothetical protein